MARLKRLAVVGVAHHVLLRARDAATVFLDAADFAAYLQLMKLRSCRLGVAMHAFALLPNEVHLLATPAAPGALSKCVQSVGRSFTAGFNQRHGRRGPLWSGRFHAVPVEPGPHLVQRLRFIDQMPCRLGLTETASDYAWSSAAHHVGAIHQGWLEDHVSFWGLGNTPFDRQVAYAGTLDQPMDDAAVREIERSVSKGWVVGSVDFIKSMELRAGRRVTPLAVGRPRKTSQQPDTDPI